MTTAAKDPYLLRVLCQHAARDDSDGIESACRNMGAIHFVNTLTGIEGMTPLHFAAAKGSVKAFQMLVKYGANINMLSKEGKRSVDYALAAGNMRIIQLIVQAQAPQASFTNAFSAPTEPSATYKTSNFFAKGSQSHMQPTNAGDVSHRSNSSEIASHKPSTIPRPEYVRQGGTAGNVVNLDQSMGSPHLAPSWDVEIRT